MLIRISIRLIFRTKAGIELSFLIRPERTAQTAKMIRTGQLLSPPHKPVRKQAKAAAFRSFFINTNAAANNVTAGITASALLLQKSRTGSNANRNVSSRALRTPILSFRNRGSSRIAPFEVTEFAWHSGRNINRACIMFNLAIFTKGRVEIGFRLNVERNN